MGADNISASRWSGSRTGSGSHHLQLLDSRFFPELSTSSIDGPSAGDGQQPGFRFDGRRFR
jgi:hypothetical protein